MTPLLQNPIAAESERRISSFDNGLGRCSFFEMANDNQAGLGMPSLNPSILALGNLVPNFGGEGSVREFLNQLEQVAMMGSWSDANTVCLCKLKMTGIARDFVWHDEKAKGATSFDDLKAILVKRFDTEPQTVRIQRFMCARQLQSEDVRAFATRVQVLAQATVADTSSPTDERSKLKKELLVDQMRSQFVNGLRDPVRRLVMSQNPQTFDEAVDAASREECNELLCGGPSRVCIVEQKDARESVELQQLKERLDNIERLLLEKREPPAQGQRRSRPIVCYACGGRGHIARRCPQMRTSGEETLPKNA